MVVEVDLEEVEMEGEVPDKVEEDLVEVPEHVTQQLKEFVMVETVLLQVVPKLFLIMASVMLMELDTCTVIHIHMEDHLELM